MELSFQDTASSFDSARRSWGKVVSKELGGVGERGGVIILCCGGFSNSHIDYLFLKIISASTLAAFTPSRRVSMFPP